MVIGRGVTHVPAEIHLTFRLPVFARSPTPTPSSSVISIKCGGCGEEVAEKLSPPSQRRSPAVTTRNEVKHGGKNGATFRRSFWGKEKKLTGTNAARCRGDACCVCGVSYFTAL